MSINYFPQGVAKGHAFLGREKESKQLKTNIRYGHHTLLMGPRRYGKTSLVRHVLSKLDYHYQEVNFYLSRSGGSVERKIRTCIEEVLGKRQTNPDTLFSAIKDYFGHSKKKWTFGFNGLASIELTPNDLEDVEENIFTALRLLESTMESLGEKVVLFFDEIQEIDLLENGKHIQGAIREFAQDSEYVIFIFSGSNRRLLTHMFDDDAMPLFELCERITLDRIPEETYEEYLQNAALATFDCKLDEIVLRRIFELSECHPKRIYNLCHQLWISELEPPILTRDVTKAWDELVGDRHSDIRVRLSKLNMTQLTCLLLIATGYSDPLTGRSSQHKLSLSSASIVKALQTLQDEDLIFKNKQRHYQVIDPLIKSVLVRYEKDLLPES